MPGFDPGFEVPGVDPGFEVPGLVDPPFGSVAPGFVEFGFVVPGVPFGLAPGFALSGLFGLFGLVAPGFELPVEPVGGAVVLPVGGCPVLPVGGVPVLPVGG